MSVTSEEEGDGRTFSRHDSSSSSNLHPHADHHNDDDEDDDVYPSRSLSGSGSEDDDDDDYDDDEDDDTSLPPPPPFSQHTFAPPFYGRPPTPLPPSPSLTSLLRPSRPTTPDASDDDGGERTGGAGGGGGGGGAGSGTGHPGEPLPRARPKVPTYEYYGFVLYLFSSLSFLIYLLWSYLPSPFLHALGIYYYPNRWWSLAIPSFLVMLLVYIYVALALYNLEILTLPLGSVETVVDEAAMVAVVDGKGRIVRGERERERRKREGAGRRTKGGRGDGEKGRAKRERDAGSGRAAAGLNWREVWNEGTDAVMDVPLAGVCEVLYGEGRDWDSEVEGEEVGITRV